MDHCEPSDFAPASPARLEGLAWFSFVSFFVSPHFFIHEVNKRPSEKTHGYNYVPTGDFEESPKVATMPFHKYVIVSRRNNLDS